MYYKYVGAFGMCRWIYVSAIRLEVLLMICLFFFSSFDFSFYFYSHTHVSLGVGSVSMSTSLYDTANELFKWLYLICDFCQSLTFFYVCIFVCVREWVIRCCAYCMLFELARFMTVSAPPFILLSILLTLFLFHSFLSPLLFSCL